MLWLSMGGSLIIFLFILLAFGIRKSGADYQPVLLPGYFFFSTAVISISSATLMLGQYAFKTERYLLFYQFVLATLVLALIFCVLQILGWAQLFQQGIFLANSIFGAFIYILTGLHLAHIFLGIFGLSVVLYDARKNSNYVDGYLLSLNPIKVTRIKLVAYFWHFVDILWWMIILFLWAQT